MELSRLLQLGGNSVRITANKLDKKEDSFQLSQAKLCTIGYHGRRTLHRLCKGLHKRGCNACNLFTGPSCALFSYSEL